MAPKVPKPVKPSAKLAREYTIERVTVGRMRAQAALEHLAIAREQLDAACRDLVALIGGADYHRVLAGCSDTVRDVGYMIDEAINLGAFASDSQPSPGEKEHDACGADPKKGPAIVAAYKQGVHDGFAVSGEGFNNEHDTHGRTATVLEKVIQDYVEKGAR